MNSILPDAHIFSCIDGPYYYYDTLYITQRIKWIYTYKYLGDVVKAINKFIYIVLKLSNLHLKLGANC